MRPGGRPPRLTILEAFLDRHHLTHLVRAIVGRVPGRPDLMKPRPDSVIRALDLLDQPATRCVLIGDSVTDIEVSRATGVHSIGYAKTATRGRELHLAGADAITDSTAPWPTPSAAARQSSRSGAVSDAADLCEVITTAPDGEWLVAFTRSLIEQRLAAAGHHQPIRSVYTWQGTIHDTAETRVALHTRTALVDRIIEQTNSRHPFEVPGVVAVPLIAASPDYARWIRDSTREPE